MQHPRVRDVNLSNGARFLARQSASVVRSLDGILAANFCILNLVPRMCAA